MIIAEIWCSNDDYDADVSKNEVNFYPQLSYSNDISESFISTSLVKIFEGFNT